jgi:hypothetical protein
MARARLLLLAVLLVWGLLSGSALMAIFPAQFQVVEEHEEKPHRAPTGSVFAAQDPRTPRVSIDQPETARLERTCRRAAMTTARLAQRVRAERITPLRL